jgi:hypothetical protein
MDDAAVHCARTCARAHTHSLQNLVSWSRSMPTEEWVEPGSYQSYLWLSHCCLMQINQTLASVDCNVCLVMTLLCGNTLVARFQNQLKVNPTSVEFVRVQSDLSGLFSLGNSCTMRF